VLTEKETILKWKEEQQKRNDEAKALLIKDGAPDVHSSKWGKLELAIPDFSPLERIAKIIDELKKVLQAVTALLEAIANLIIGLEDAAAQLIKEIIVCERKHLRDF
jgi:hypothetical protein